MSDAIRAISESASILSKGPYLKMRYYDIIHPKPKDTRTGEEIAADVIKNAGITLVKGEK